MQPLMEQSNRLNNWRLALSSSYILLLSTSKVIIITCLSNPCCQIQINSTSSGKNLSEGCKFAFRGVIGCPHPYTCILLLCQWHSPTEAAIAFWKVIRGCLLRIHHFQQETCRHLSCQINTQIMRLLILNSCWIKYLTLSKINSQYTIPPDRGFPRLGRAGWNPRWCKCGNDPTTLSLRL